MTLPATATTRLFLLALFALLLALPVAASTPHDLHQRLIGAWEEHTPGHNYFELGSEGQIVVHLRQGQVAGQRRLEGHWWVEGGDILMMAMEAMDRVPQPIGRIRFEGQELLLEADDGSVTRNRRVSAPPPEYVW